MEQKISDCIITDLDKELFDLVYSWWDNHPEKFANNFPNLGAEEFGIDPETFPF